MRGEVRLRPDATVVHGLERVVAVLSGPAAHLSVGLGAALGVGLAVLLWVPSRHGRWRRAQGVLAVAGEGWPSGDGSDPSTDPRGGGAALRRLWSADPVEVLRAWRLRRRPGDVLPVALDLLVAVGAGLDAGLTTARALEVATVTVADPAATDPGPGAGRRRGLRTRRTPGGPAALAADLLAAARAAVPERPVSQVWQEWSQRCRSIELAFVAAAWRLSETTGAPLSDAVHRAAQGLRDDARRRGRVAAAVAGPRSTVAVLTVLPLAGPPLGLACGVDPVTLYLGSPVATGSVVLGAALAGLGRWWARRMVAGVRP